MEALEIRNPELFFEQFQQVSIAVRTLPSAIMLWTAAKFIILFAMCIIALISSVAAVLRIAIHPSNRNRNVEVDVD